MIYFGKKQPNLLYHIKNILWRYSSRCKKILLNFTCLTMKYHNCHTFNKFNNFSQPKKSQSNCNWKWCEGLGFVLIITGFVYFYLLVGYGLKVTDKWKKAMVLKAANFMKIPLHGVGYFLTASLKSSLTSSNTVLWLFKICLDT